MSVENTVEKKTKTISTFELIMVLRKMKVGEESMLGEHKIKRISKYRFDYVCPCCVGRSIAYGKR